MFTDEGRYAEIREDSQVTEKNQHALQENKQSRHQAILEDWQPLELHPGQRILPAQLAES